MVSNKEKYLKGTSKRRTFMVKVRKAVIPAAGLGTRMLPATKSVPKEMLPIGDRPAIHYIVQEAVASGIEDILIITNRDKSAMEDYFDYSPELEGALSSAGKSSLLDLVRNPADVANIFYVRQKETKGLGHAVWKAKSFVGGEPFAVLLGDDIMVGDTPVTKQLIDAAEKFDASAVGVQEVPLDLINKYCSLKVDSIGSRAYKVLDMIEKPEPQQVFSQLAILGRYVLRPEIFAIIENTPPGYGGEIQLTDALRALCKVSPMVAVDFQARRYDVGNTKGFLEATIDFALAEPSTGSWLRQYLESKFKP